MTVFMKLFLMFVIVMRTGLSKATSHDGYSHTLNMPINTSCKGSNGRREAYLPLLLAGFPEAVVAPQWETQSWTTWALGLIQQGDLQQPEFQCCTGPAALQHRNLFRIGLRIIK